VAGKRTGYNHAGHESVEDSTTGTTSSSSGTAQSRRRPPDLGYDSLGSRRQQGGRAGAVSDLSEEVRRSSRRHGCASRASSRRRSHSSQRHRHRHRAASAVDRHGHSLLQTHQSCYGPMSDANGTGPSGSGTRGHRNGADRGGVGRRVSSGSTGDIFSGFNFSFSSAEHLQELNMLKLRSMSTSSSHGGGSGSLHHTRSRSSMSETSKASTQSADAAVGGPSGAQQQTQQQQQLSHSSLSHNNGFSVSVGGVVNEGGQRLPSNRSPPHAPVPRSSLGTSSSRRRTEPIVRGHASTPPTSPPPDVIVPHVLQPSWSSSDAASTATRELSSSGSLSESKGVSSLSAEAHLSKDEARTKMGKLDFLEGDGDDCGSETGSVVCVDE
jgi:hypothetical protein